MCKATARGSARILGGVLCGAIMGAALLASSAPASAGSICFEAEKASLTGVFQKNCQNAGISAVEMQEVRKAASGQNYIGVPEDGEKETEPAAGSATIKFNIGETGTYSVWVRAWWLDSCANTFKMRIDDFDAFIMGGDNTYQTWHWVKFKTPFPLKPGEHVLYFSNNEDGAAADQLFLTTTKVVPQGAMKASQ